MLGTNLTTKAFMPQEYTGENRDWHSPLSITFKRVWGFTLSPAEKARRFNRRRRQVSKTFKN
jgi:hypothetical protein